MKAEGAGGGMMLSDRHPTESSDLNDQIVEIGALISNKTTRLVFPSHLERSFRSATSASRVDWFLKVAIIGICVFNSFIFTDLLIIPDVMIVSLVLHLAIVTPLSVILIYYMAKRILRPELSVTIALVMICFTIVFLYGSSQSKYSSYLIFTIPVCLAFGNVVLPLPFRMSVGFTTFCIVISSIALVFRSDWSVVLGPFAILINVNTAAYMLIGTYRMEASERSAYLFNRREVLRAEQLAHSNRRLQNLSSTDSLTGVANRRHFDAEFKRVCDQAMGRPTLSVLMIDIDHFKALNDTLGHASGDRALQLVARCLKQHVLPGALVARYGGEEFIVLLPDVGLAYARSCAEALRVAVEVLAVGSALHEMPAPVTVSIGVASVDPDAGIIPATLVKAADQSLYRAKANGRNRVECWFGRTGLSSPRAVGPQSISA